MRVFAELFGRLRGAVDDVVDHEGRAGDMQRAMAQRFERDLVPPAGLGQVDGIDGRALEILRHQDFTDVHGLEGAARLQFRRRCDACEIAIARRRLRCDDVTLAGRVAEQTILEEVLVRAGFQLAKHALLAVGGQLRLQQGLVHVPELGVWPIMAVVEIGRDLVLEENAVLADLIDQGEHRALDRAGELAAQHAPGRALALEQKVAKFKLGAIDIQSWEISADRFADSLIDLVFGCL